MLNEYQTQSWNLQQEMREDVMRLQDRLAESESQAARSWQRQGLRIKSCEGCCRGLQQRKEWRTMWGETTDGSGHALRVSSSQGSVPDQQTRVRQLRGGGGIDTLRNHSVT